MSLTGTFERTLDAKLRLALPRRFRDELVTPTKPRMYLTPESDQSLGLFATTVFQQRANRLESHSGSSVQVKNYMRLYYSQAEEVEVDSQGRFRIPDRLAAYAGLKQDVVLLGVHDHVEIWERSAWDQFLATHSAEFDRLASEAFA